MNLAQILVLLLVAVVALVLLAWRQAAARRPPPPTQRAGQPSAITGPRPEQGALPTHGDFADRTRTAWQPLPAGGTAEPVWPPELLAFSYQLPDDLPEARRLALTVQFANLPRPPRLLNQLTSPDFLATASSSQLAEMVVAEPVIAARVLATVNSPLYGFQSPVNSLGQAMTYLGLNAVRSLCLQYLMLSAFKADTPARQAQIDQTWRASLLASELAQRLVRQLDWPDAGGLVSAVVLSFLGRLATVTVMPTPMLATLPHNGFLARTQAEQAHFGLGAGQIGALLMQTWDLPESLVQQVRAIDQVLVWHSPLAGLTPAATEARLRATLGYLCARLGEQLVSGELTDLAQLDLASLGGPDWHLVQPALQHPSLARLPECLRSAELLAAIQKAQRAAL